jgi:hypothetical protein
VIEHVEAAPLLQQSAILEHYRSLSVRFTGNLISAAKIWEGRIGVILASADRQRSRGVTFEIDPAKYPGLGLLKSGHEVTVIGTIKNVSSGIVWLGDAEVSFKLPA